MEERVVDSNSNTLNLPVLCTRGLICFPNNEINIDIARPKSIKAIEAARNKFSDLLFVTTQIDTRVDNPELKDLYTNDKDSLEKYTKILYSQARLIEGLPIDNPTEISNLICDIIAND